MIYGDSSWKTNLIAKDWYANVALFVDAGMIDLRGEGDLPAKARVKTAQHSMRLRCELTDGALNGKFSGRVKVKWNVPPLYGLSFCIQ